MIMKTRPSPFRLSIVLSPVRARGHGRFDVLVKCPPTSRMIHYAFLPSKLHCFSSTFTSFDL